MSFYLIFMILTNLKYFDLGVKTNFIYSARKSQVFLSMVTIDEKTKKKTRKLEIIAISIVRPSDLLFKYDWYTWHEYGRITMNLSCALSTLKIKVFLSKRTFKSDLLILLIQTNENLWNKWLFIARMAKK